MINFLSQILPWFQVISAIILVVLVLLQQNESSLGGAFGGDSGATNIHKRRGLEKIIFDATFIVAVLFVGSVLISLVF